MTRAVLARARQVRGVEAWGVEDGTAHRRSTCRRRPPAPGAASFAAGQPCWQRRCRRGDTGSGTVLVLTAAAVLLMVGLVLTSLAAVGVARHRAASVADLSALAAAASSHLGSGPACAAAHDVASRSAARLLDCRVVGDMAQVTAGVRPPGRLGELGEAVARARAGPASQP